MQQQFVVSLDKLIILNSETVMLHFGGRRVREHHPCCLSCVDTHQVLPHDRGKGEISGYKIITKPGEKKKSNNVREV